MKYIAAIVLAIFATPALSHDEGDFCAERPGQTTPPCVLQPGRMMIETAATSWVFKSDKGSRSDTILVGDSLMRVGVMPRIEAQIGWTPAGYVRFRDQTTGTTSATTRTGDVTLGLLYGLMGQNGPVAIQSFVSLPFGHDPVGAGDWGAGLRLPVSLPVADGIQLALTPELDAAVNNTGSGRHLAYGGAVGVGYALSYVLQLGADIGVFRDEAPAGTTTSTTASLSVAWQASPDTQLDVGVAAGLNRDSPDVEIYFGIAHRF